MDRFSPTSLNAAGKVHRPGDHPDPRSAAAAELRKGLRAPFGLTGPAGLRPCGDSAPKIWALMLRFLESAVLNHERHVTHRRDSLRYSLHDLNATRGRSLAEAATGQLHYVVSIAEGRCSGQLRNAAAPPPAKGKTNNRARRADSAL
jgi:hypothetical protein